MPAPRLSRHLPQVLRRPKPPTVGDLISGGHEPPLSEAQQHGAGVLAALAQRDLDAAAAFAEARDRNAADAQAADDERWAEHLRRSRPVRPIGGGR